MEHELDLLEGRGSAGKTLKPKKLPPLRHAPALAGEDELSPNSMRTELHKSKRKVRDQEQQIGQITRDAQQLARDLEAQIDQLRSENEAHRRQRKGRQADDQARDL